MEIPFLLTLENVKREARKAYEEKRLTAQAVDAEDRVCKYIHTTKTGVKLCCAIGAALPEELAIKLRQSDSVYMLAMMNEYVSVKNGEIEFMYNIQAAHDSWCKKRGFEKEEYFLRLLND